MSNLDHPQKSEAKRPQPSAEHQNLSANGNFEAGSDDIFRHIEADESYLINDNHLSPPLHELPDTYIDMGMFEADEGTASFSHELRGQHITRKLTYKLSNGIDFLTVEESQSTPESLYDENGVVIDSFFLPHRLVPVLVQLLAYYFESKKLPIDLSALKKLDGGSDIFGVDIYSILNEDNPRSNAD